MKPSLKFFLACLSITMFYACSTQKDNPTNRGLQNLSARYNYIYNSNVLLDTYQEELALTQQDKFDEFLPVYIAPATADFINTTPPIGNVKALDEITQKAQMIIAEKGLSNYVDEAYLLLAKTNFYKGNYFSATAYFDYAAKAYKKDKKVFLTAMTWKARSLMQLNDFDAAEKVLDTVKLTLDSVKNEKADPLATIAQINIYKGKYKDAIGYLEQAIKETNKMESRTRWPFILAQLYEHEKEYDASLKYYTRVENSNAPFEMYFNAKLSKIRIDDVLYDQTFDRKQALLRLLKDDKNIDYTDQIYYEVAEDYFGDKDFVKAEEYYKISAQKSTRNAYQKGLAYLKLAELNFKNLANYVNAKLYYDSAATTLPKTYAGYDAILKISQNLEYLTQRYQLIAEQDTLQMIARLPQQAREKRINEIFEPKVIPNANIKLNNVAAANNNSNKLINNGTFYFNNVSAISRGFTDFKKRWGNRPLEDNWRQSVKSSQQVNQQSTIAAIGNQTPNGGQETNESISAKVAAYVSKLPLTATQLQQSDQQIIDAYFEIAAFYQQVLNDQKEAIKVYEILLARYPQNNHLDAIYYSLYLDYKELYPAKSESFKNLILAKFPGSIYAKTLLDPNFSIKQNALDVEIKKLYNSVFDSYEKKDFLKVITTVNETNTRFPDNSLQAQFDYLKAIAIGRTQPIDSLLIRFNEIIVKYPNDPLITPLVKDHLAYINTNIGVFKARKIALVDFDPTEPRFIAQQTVVVQKPTSPIIKTEPVPVVVKPVIIEPKKDTVINNNPVVNVVPNAIITPNAVNEPIKQIVADNLFSKAESTVYYYVIAVNDMSLSVSSSRFGVGQFNRGNYSGTGLKHQLQELSEDQLIFVGNFNTLSEVKTYADGITGQLTRIMKVPVSTYKWFYITKENFDKITNRETLNRYLEFFKTNY